MDPHGWFKELDPSTRLHHTLQFLESNGPIIHGQAEVQESLIDVIKVLVRERESRQEIRLGEKAIARDGLMRTWEQLGVDIDTIDGCVRELLGYFLDERKHA